MIGVPNDFAREWIEKRLAGQVAAALADVLGGDVVYQVVIALDEIPEGLRAGMSVTVHFPGE